MKILGINAYHGDASAVLLENGKLVWAGEEERFNRVKHSAGVPAKAFKAAMESNGKKKKMDYVTVSRNPAANFFPKLEFILRKRPSLSFLMDRLKVAKDSGKILEQLAQKEAVILNVEAMKRFPRLLRCFAPRNDVVRIEHHLSHAASAFYPSGFERAALLTVDGFGDFSSTMFGIGKGNRIKVLKRVLFPHSLGALYTAATQFLGFLKYGDEYKVMGLAAYGEPKYLKEFRELIHLEPDGGFKLNLNFFIHPEGKTEMTWDEGEPVQGLAYSDKWRELFGRPRRPEDPISQHDKDLAASCQAVFEETFFHLLKHLYEMTNVTTLCLAGGCAFNSLANGKIFDHSPFKQVYIQAAAGDAGTALGSALYTYHHRLNQPRNFVMDHAYWGPEFSEKEISEELNRRKMTAQRIQNETILCQKTAEAIAEGKVVGWFQGRMEWGPRALGNRSILANPGRTDMKDILNARIKHREGFRPFAPSVLEEKAGEWFEMKTPTSPFMNLVFPVRQDKKSQIPAVTHVDGTARVHTVSRQTNPLFWNLIQEFEKKTGVPLLLNTSFNDNEPIVCTPADAIGCFLRTRMDLLVLGTYWIERRENF